MTGSLRSRRAARAARLAALAAALAFGALPARADDLARGDAAWEGRARGERAGRALPGPIRIAVQAYERALLSHPESLEARWKLLRALHFAGEFAAEDERAARGHFDRAREVGEAGLAQLAERVGSGKRLETLPPEQLRARLDATDTPGSDVARLYFWSAIGWGAWSRTVGIVSAVRQGVADRVYRYTLVAMDLEPEYEDGGAFRLLGRLHAELPRVPFVSGWVDREQAVPLVERACSIAPEHPGNRLLLALTLLELAPTRRAEALELLVQVRQLTPRPSMRIEDLAVRELARDRLADSGFSEPA